MHTSSNDSSCLYGLFFIWPILIRKKQEKKRNFFIADCLDEFIWLLFNLYSIYVFADSYLAGKSFAGVSFYSAAAFLSVKVVCGEKTAKENVVSVCGIPCACLMLFYGDFLCTTDDWSKRIAEMCEREKINHSVLHNSPLYPLWNLGSFIPFCKIGVFV